MHNRAKVKRYELTNAADGWRCQVVRVDMQQGDAIIRTWSTDGRELQATPDGRLILHGTDTIFVLPEDEDDGN